MPNIANIQHKKGLDFCMLTLEHLQKLCVPLEGSDIYFRPLVCKGNLDQIGIFIVGINPATSIKTNVPIDEYLEMLTNYQKFDDYYVGLRREAGKRSDHSRTRLGTNSLVRKLTDTPIIKSQNIAIAETNIIPFPTKNIKELKALEKENPALIKEARTRFLDLLEMAKPRLIIVHSKTAFDELVELISEQYGLDEDIQKLKDSKIEALESISDLLSIPYSKSRKCNLMVCRHLMYFGTVGNSYTAFLMNVENIISSVFSTSKNSIS